MQYSKFRAALAAASVMMALAACDSERQAAPAAITGADAAPAAASTPANAAPAAPAAPVESLEPRYDATLAQGIEFARAGYPSFVVEAAGISGAESWGRWTDASLAPNARLRFSGPLPQRFALNLKVRDFFGLNAGKDVTVTAGDKAQTFLLAGDKDQDVKLTFEGVQGDTIEISVPNVSAPSASDNRKMGLGLISLSIQE